MRMSKFCGIGTALTVSMIVISARGLHARPTHTLSSAEMALLQGAGKPCDCTGEDNPGDTTTCAAVWSGSNCVGPSGSCGGIGGGQHKSYGKGATIHKCQSGTPNTGYCDKSLFVQCTDLYTSTGVSQAYSDRQCSSVAGGAKECKTASDSCTTCTFADTGDPQYKPTEKCGVSPP